MRKYVITAPNFKGEMILEYDLNGVLKSFVNNAELSPEQLYFLRERLPIMHSEVDQISSTTIVTEVTDLSFTRFWNDYNYKIGNKGRCEKLFNKLDLSEKLALFQSIPKYNRYLKLHPSIERAYAETYIYQRRFENEYK